MRDTSNDIKAGDWVEVVEEHSLLRLGARYRVETVSSYVWLKGTDPGAGGGWYKSRFKIVDGPLAPIVTHKWIVCALDKAGNIKPSNNPRLMRSEHQAIAVSKSMAEDHIGTAFAAVSYVVGPTFRAEAVEVKTVSTKVIQVG